MEDIFCGIAKAGRGESEVTSKWQCDGAKRRSSLCPLLLAGDGIKWPNCRFCEFDNLGSSYFCKISYLGVLFRATP